MMQDSAIPALPHASRDWRSIARLIDHTLLKPETTSDQVARLCQEALHYGFATVCVHPWQIAKAAEMLRGSTVKAGTVVAFPHGATLPGVKRFEAAESLRAGAQELDMVVNVGALKSGAADFVESDIRGVVEVAHQGGAILKVILEASLLNREEIILACELAVAAGADFVKTSTGLLGGATVEDVALLRSVVSARAQVKASGGIRTLADLTAMLAAGADRIGTSSSVSILRELNAREPGT